MTYEELLEISELRKYTYEDYMCNQPMRDGEEIRNFFDSLDWDNYRRERSEHAEHSDL